MPAGARGRLDLRGHRLRRPRARRRRPRRQHLADRLPGGLHRPQLRRPGGGHDLPAHRQPRARSPTTTSRSGPGCAASSSATPRPACSAGPARSSTCCGLAGVPAIAGLDTRALARHLRASGSLRGIITAPGEVDPDAAVGVRRVPCRPGRPRTSSHRCRRAPRTRWVTADRSWPSWTSASRRTSSARCTGAARACGCCRTRPAAEQVLAADVEGVVLSPGPGDPGMLDGPVELARAVIADGRPLLGICLGHQIVARAAGAGTRRLRFGHHAANHPVRDEGSGRVTVTAQNHEVEVIADSLPVESGLLRQPAQPQRRLRRGPAPSRPAHRDRAVPPRGLTRPARRGRGLRPLPGARPRPRAHGQRHVTLERPRSILILGSGPGHHRPGRRVRLRRHAGLPGPARGGHPHHPPELQPGHHHDRPRRRGRRLPRAAHGRPPWSASSSCERPDGMLASLGGQTGLNLAMEVARAGLLERTGTRLLGTPIEAIEMAEDRERFRDLLDAIGQPYAPSAIVEGADDAERGAATRRALEAIGLPAIVRPAFTLGGTGGGIVDSRRGVRGARARRPAPEPHRPGHGGALPRRAGRRSSTRSCAMRPTRASPSARWRTSTRSASTPATPSSWRRCRRCPTRSTSACARAALAIIRALGVEGGCNVQFALSPDASEYAVIEVNPRVSRSSALASKATGYPIARVAAQIAIGRRLDEIPNAITGTHRGRLRAGPRLRRRQAAALPLRQVPGRRALAGLADEGDRRGHGHRPHLRGGPQQGAARPRAGGRRVPGRGSRLAAARSTSWRAGRPVDEPGSVPPSRSRTSGRGAPGRAPHGCRRPRLRAGTGSRAGLAGDAAAALPAALRLAPLAAPGAAAPGVAAGELQRVTGIAPWFLSEMERLADARARHARGGAGPVGRPARDGQAGLLQRSRHRHPGGLSRRTTCAARRHAMGLRPGFAMVDTCAAEFAAETPYFYATYAAAGSRARGPAGRRVRRRSSSARARCASARASSSTTARCRRRRRCGRMAGRRSWSTPTPRPSRPTSTPRRASTSSRSTPRASSRSSTPRRRDGEGPLPALVQFGGQTPLNLAAALARPACRCRASTSRPSSGPRSGPASPTWSSGWASPSRAAAWRPRSTEALAVAEEVGYPVLVRPSFVIGGLAIDFCYGPEDLERQLADGDDA